MQVHAKNLCCGCFGKVIFFLPSCFFFSLASYSLRPVPQDGNGGGWFLLPLEPQRAGGAAGKTGDRAKETEGGVGTSAVSTGQTRVGAAAVEAAGARPRGLHRHTAGAHHGAKAHTVAGARQAQVTANSQLHSPPTHTKLCKDASPHCTSLAFSLLRCPA